MTAHICPPAAARDVADFPETDAEEGRTLVGCQRHLRYDVAVSFASFLDHYGSTGREFGDGYVACCFEDMLDDERARARDMLLTRGLRGNGVDIAGLAHVGDATTVAALDDAGRRDADPCWDAIRLETLFALTGDRRHLDAMIAWLDDPDDETRGFAANLLSRQAVPGGMAPAILALIEDGRHEELLLPLVAAWLAAHGIPAGSDMAIFRQHLPLLHAVRAARPAGRQALLEAAVRL